MPVIQGIAGSDIMDSFAEWEKHHAALKEGQSGTDLEASV